MANRSGVVLGFALVLSGAYLLACIPDTRPTVLLQGDGGGMGVPQEMVEFGHKLEREGQTAAGAKLAMEGEELAKQQLLRRRYTPQGSHQANAGGAIWNSRAMAPRRSPSSHMRNGESFIEDESVPLQIEHEDSSSAKSSLMLQPATAEPGHAAGASGGQEEEGGLGRRAYDGRWWSNARGPFSGFSSRGSKAQRMSNLRSGMLNEDVGDDAEEEVATMPPFRDGRERTATGLPGAYDGAYGAQYRKDAGGRQEAVTRAGINSDDYPVDIYKGVPWFTFDPSAAKTRSVGQYKASAKPYTMQSGKMAGENVWPAGWGTLHEGTEAHDKLSRAGIVVDKWPIEGDKSFPNPAWDRSEHDSEKGIDKMPHMDARSVVLDHRASQAALENAGVKLNGFPISDGNDHEMNNVDGMLDTVVSQDEIPKYRDQGVAGQERPFHFLLDEDPNGPAEGQTDAIGKMWTSGKLDSMPQVQENADEGIEYDPSNPNHVSFNEEEGEEPVDDQEGEEEE